MDAKSIADGHVIPLPPRRLTATVGSVRRAALRHGVDAENELRANALAESIHDDAWLEAAKLSLGLSEGEELRLRKELRARNLAIWGAYADTDDD